MLRTDSSKFSFTAHLYYLAQLQRLVRILEFSMNQVYALQESNKEVVDQTAYPIDTKVPINCSCFNGKKCLNHKWYVYCFTGNIGKVRK